MKMNKFETYSNRRIQSPIFAFEAVSLEAFRLQQYLKQADSKPRLRLTETSTEFKQMFVLPNSQARCIALVDLDGQDGTGWELLAWCQAEVPNCSVIALISDKSLDATLKAFELGACSVLLKPTSAAELHEAIARVDAFQDQ